MVHGETGLGNSLSCGSACSGAEMPSCLLPPLCRLASTLACSSSSSTHFCLLPAPGRFMEARLGLRANVTSCGAPKVTAINIKLPPLAKELK